MARVSGGPVNRSGIEELTAGEKPVYILKSPVKTLLNNDLSHFIAAGGIVIVGCYV
jgi:hypothetical protein